VSPVRRRSLVIGVVIGLIVGAGAAYALSRGDDPKLDARLSGTADTAGGNPGLAQGDAAGKALPELTFTRFDGSKVNLSDLRGKPVVLNLWASNCAPCVQEMPAIERVHQELKDRVTVIGIDTSDPSRSDAKKLAAKTGVTYDLAIDQDGQLAQALDFVVLPTTVLVDANGRVVTSHAGALDEGKLTDLIDKSFPA
jgi:thiol-disulfide isomerase/thioredoxin